MWYPYTWHAAKTPSPSKGPRYFKFKAMPFPEETCEEDAPNPIGCKFELRIAEWFTNDTHIPGQPTLPEEMYDQWMHRRNRKNPWEAPGTAPVFGDGCGVNGGNPNGCGRGMFGLLKSSITLLPTNLLYHFCSRSGNLYGNCCGKNCGGYEGGRPALEYAAEGEFDDAPVTEWVRGQPAEVYWQQTAEHRGGYAYRLCKVRDHIQ